MTTVSCIQPSQLLENLMCSWNGKNNQNKCIRNIFPLWTLWLNGLLGATCSANTRLLHVPVSELHLILSLLHVAAKSPYKWPPVSRITCMNLLTCIIFKVSLAVNLSNASISADSSEMHGWKKEKKKTWITKTKVSLPKIYFQTRQHWLTQRKLRWSKVFPSPTEYRIYSKKPRGASEIFGLVGKRPISGRRERG